MKVNKISKMQNLYGLKVSVSNIKKHEFYEESNLESFLNELYNSLKKYKGASNYIDLQNDILRNGASKQEIEEVIPFVFKSIGKYQVDDNNIKEREFEYKFYSFKFDCFLIILFFQLYIVENMIKFRKYYFIDSQVTVNELNI